MLPLAGLQGSVEFVLEASFSALPQLRSYQLAGRSVTAFGGAVSLAVELRQPWVSRRQPSGLVLWQAAELQTRVG